MDKFVRCPLLIICFRLEGYGFPTRKTRLDDKVTEFLTLKRRLIIRLDYFGKPCWAGIKFRPPLVMLTGLSRLQENDCIHQCPLSQSPDMKGPEKSRVIFVHGDEGKDVGYSASYS